jgi:hypothetical protein
VIAVTCFLRGNESTLYFNVDFCHFPARLLLLLLRSMRIGASVYALDAGEYQRQEFQLSLSFSPKFSTAVHFLVSSVGRF